jgi:hypothetical protein
MEDSKNTPFWANEPLIGEDEIFCEMGERRGTTLFLGKFTMTEVFAVMGRKGFFKEARKRRLWPLAFDLNSSEYPLQRFRIFLRENAADNLIVDLKIREGCFRPKERPAPGFPARTLKGLIVEWLTLQNPAAEFEEKRGSLPGQQHPGLGMSKKIIDVFVYLAKVTRSDCILAFPAYYHNGVLFSRYFRFISPEKEGEVQSIRRTFSRLPIRQLAWAVHLNCLRTSDGGVYEWTAEEQLFPLAKDLKDHFDSRSYKEAVKLALKKNVFTIDQEAFERKFDTID